MRILVLMLLAAPRWTTLPGVWYPSEPQGTVQLDDAGLRLRGPVAVRYPTPVSGDAWSIRAEIDPVEGDTASLGWVSFMLAPKPQKLGWVTDPESEVGVLVRSNGAVQVFGSNAEWPHSWASGPPAPAARYQVALEVRKQNGTLVVDGTVNQARFTATIRGVKAGRARYLAIGAHFHPGDVESSWVGGLAFSPSARAR